MASRRRCGPIVSTSAGSTLSCILTRDRRRAAPARRPGSSSIRAGCPLSAASRTGWTARSGGAIVLAAGMISLGVLGWLSPSLSGLGALLGVAGAGLAAREIRRSEQAMRDRVAGEERRVATIRRLQETRLFEWQAQHADQARDWQARRDAYERQKYWYAMSLACDIDRVDVAGGTLPGWSAMLTMIGMPRLQSGGELTVVDLTDGAVAGDLVAVSRRAGIDPLVWVLPDDLPRLDLGTGLAPAALADLLALAASAGDEQEPAQGMSRDHAILERVIGLLGEGGPGQRRAAGPRPDRRPP
jgi:hypothetical protein